MENWKKWLNADYAFSNNGEKIKKVIKFLYILNTLLFLIAGGIGGIYLFVSGFANGAILTAFLALIGLFLFLLLVPFLVYWSLSPLYGFAELISNSYKESQPPLPTVEKQPSSTKRAEPAQEKSATEPTEVSENTNVVKPSEGPAKQIGIAYFAEDGAPATASYSINNCPSKMIRSGETNTEAIHGDSYQLKISAGLFRIKGQYLAKNNSTRTFVCTKKKLEEK